MCSTRVLHAAGRHHREAGRAAPQGQVGDDLPGRRARSSCSLIVDRDAAVHRPDVQGDLRRPRRHAAAADAGPARVSDLAARSSSRSSCSSASASFVLPPVDQAPTAGRRSWDAFKLRVPGLRRARAARPRWPASPARSSALRPLRRARSSSRSTSSPRPSGNAVVADAVRDTQAAVKRGDSLAAPARGSTRCSRRWSCR